MLGIKGLNLAFTWSGYWIFLDIKLLFIKRQALQEIMQAQDLMEDI